MLVRFTQEHLEEGFFFFKKKPNKTKKQREKRFSNTYTMDQLHKGHLPDMKRVLKEVSLREIHLVNMASMFLKSGLMTSIIWELLPVIMNCLGKGTVFCLCSPSIYRILKCF